MKIFNKKNKRIIQGLSFLALNPYFFNFFTGRLYTGNLKYFPFPVLNCWSCPASTFACPIGALANIFSLKKFPFYTLGILALASYKKNIFCGYLCPFGAFQELIYKIPFYKLSKHKNSKAFRIYLKLDKPLKKLKYLVLIFLVVLIPFFFHKNLFCIICPPAFLEASLPFIVIFSYLRDYISFYFYLKIFIFFLFTFLSLIMIRPFCRYFCPLIAIFDIFAKMQNFSSKENKISKSKQMEK